MANFGDIPANQDNAATFAVATSRGNVLGDNTGGAPAAGNIGELIAGLATGVSIPTATPTNVISVSLTAGDWLIIGHVTFKYSAATQSGDGQAGVNNTSATLPASSLTGYDNTRQTTTTSNATVNAPIQRLNLLSTTTWYLVAQTAFSAGSCTADGKITAIRTN